MSDSGKLTDNPQCLAPGDDSEIDTLSRILSETKRIAVVGLSANWFRPSYFSAKYLQDHGYTIVPVNPRYETVLDETCYPDLQSIPEPVDVVNVFQRSEAVPPIAQAAIEIKAKVLWLQLGVQHAQSQHQAHDAGLDVVANRCMKIEHGRIFGGLGLIGVNTGIISSKRPRVMSNRK